MGDVTFGVKVSEEMKNELSELMKNSTLSGKEFMQMLLTSYKLEERKRSNEWIESEVSELQFLLQRIQNLYLNMNEKAEVRLQAQLHEKREEIEQFKKGQEELQKRLEEEHQQLLKKEEAFHLKEEAYKTLEETSKQKEKSLQEVKQQLTNVQLLQSKFEEEIERYKEKIESLQRLEREIDERNEENTKLKTRNDELASEIWFLKRELEKGEEEKKYVLSKCEDELRQLRSAHALELKNSLLELKLSSQEKIQLLKEENLRLQQDFSAKLEALYGTRQE